MSEGTVCGCRVRISIGNPLPLDEPAPDCPFCDGTGVLKRTVPADALARAMEMLQIPMGQLPRLALEYLNELKSRVGLCIEVCIAAYAAYAQCVEGRKPSDDPAYRAGPIEEKFFAERMTPEDKAWIIDEAFKPITEVSSV